MLNECQGMPSEYLLSSSRIPEITVLTRGYVMLSQIPFSLFVHIIKFRVPFSSIFSSNTAYAVVPEPGVLSSSLKILTALLLDLPKIPIISSTVKMIYSVFFIYKLVP